MPTYTMKNKASGEVTEMILSLSERDQLLDTGEWDQQLSTPNFVSDTKSTLRRAGSDWSEHLTRIKKGSGRDNSITV